MEVNYSVCLKAILKEEGGNDDDPHDPGGRTSRGIIQREYDAYRQHKGLPKGDVWKATDDEVADIYRTSYWFPYCPDMPDGIDLVYFDMAVNAGPVRSAKTLQKALGVNADGHIGIVTLGAIKAVAIKGDTVSLIKKFSEGRRTFYRGLGTFKYFGKGWLARTGRIETQAIKLAAAHGS